MNYLQLKLAQMRIRGLRLALNSCFPGAPSACTAKQIVSARIKFIIIVVHQEVKTALQHEVCFIRNAAAPSGLLKISQLRSGALKFSVNSSARALFCAAAMNNSIT